jgi:hypothetical protein
MSSASDCEGEAVGSFVRDEVQVQRSSDDDALAPQQIGRFKRKRSKHDHPWQLNHEWTEGEHANKHGRRQCTLCRVWYSGKTNASGWKAHFRSKHGISGSGTASSGQGKVLVRSTLGEIVFPDGVQRKFENAIVDDVVGGGISLRAAGGQRFEQLVVLLTNGYEPPPTRTNWRRIVELFHISEPLQSSFLRQLDVAISLMLDGWFNRNLKGFYVVTVHWVDVSSMAIKSLLLTIIDVACGTGVGRRVGTALFEHLKGMGRDVLTRLLNVVNNNGGDVTAAVKQLFQLVNGAVGYEQMLPSNHVRCSDHSVQLGGTKVLTLVQKTNEQLRQVLVSIRRSKVM